MITVTVDEALQAIIALKNGRALAAIHGGPVSVCRAICAILMSVPASLTANGGFMMPKRSSNGCRVQALSLQIGNPVSFQTGEVRLSWHGAIVTVCDKKRISNPPTMLHLTPELTAL